MVPGIRYKESKSRESIIKKLKIKNNILETLTDYASKMKWNRFTLEDMCRNEEQQCDSKISELLNFAEEKKQLFVKSANFC